MSDSVGTTERKKYLDAAKAGNPDGGLRTYHKTWEPDRYLV